MIFIAISILFLLATPSSASAQLGFLGSAGGWVVDQLASGAGILIASLVAAIFWLLNWVGFAILALAATFLEAIMAFVLSTPYTPLHDSNPEVLITAWQLVRDMANMLFILILVAIGVGTMLEIKVQGQQIGPNLLLPFIVVAALINFSPLLTGMVIDISNILTKFFFDVSIGGANLFINENPFFSNAGNLGDVLTTNLDVSASFALQMVTAFMFNLLTSLILVTVGFLLIMRVLAIWLLVIFSPLAFAAYILPQTKSYFRMWWSQFLQWAMLPVTLGLFLWIAALILSAGGASCTFQNVGQQNTGGYYAPGNEILQGSDGNGFCKATMSMMALGTIVVGMFVSFSTSAAGSKYIINRAQSVRKAAPRWMGRQTRRAAIQGTPIAAQRAKQGAGALARRTPQPLRNMAAAGAIRYGVSAQNKAVAVGKGVQKIGNLPGVKQARGAGVALGKGAVAPAVGYAQTTITKEKEMWKGVKKFDGMKGNFNALRRQASLELSGDNKAKLIDLMATEHQDDFGKLDKQEVFNLLKSVRFQSGAAKNALKVHPDLSSELARVEGKDPAAELKKQVGKLTDKDIENTASSSWANDAFVKEMVEQNKLSAKLYEKIGTKNLKAIQNLDESMRRIGQEVAGSSDGGIDEKKWERYLSENTDMARELREFTNSSPALKVLAGTNQVQVVDEAGNAVKNRDGRPVMRKEGVLYRKPNQGSGGGETTEGESNNES